MTAVLLDILVAVGGAGRNGLDVEAAALELPWYLEGNVVAGRILEG